jgi:hypothetical protein
VAVSRAGPQDVLVEAGQESDRSRRPRRGQLVEVLGQYVRGLTGHLDVSQQIA